MILIAGTFTIQEEDREAAIAAMTEMMAETAKEDGCVSYDMTSSFDDPTKIHLFEEWESEEHLQAHFVAPHMAVFQKAVASIGPVERNIFKYSAGEKSPL